MERELLVAEELSLSVVKAHRKQSGCFKRGNAPIRCSSQRPADLTSLPIFPAYREGSSTLCEHGALYSANRLYITQVPRIAELHRSKSMCAQCLYKYKTHCPSDQDYHTVLRSKRDVRQSPHSVLQRHWLTCLKGLSATSTDALRHMITLSGACFEVRRREASNE